jgi:hypothetical protein
MKIGDPCVIWNGESPIGDPSSWLFGVIVKVKKDKDMGKEKYQAIWSESGGVELDKNWYDFNDIKLENVEDRW